MGKIICRLLAERKFGFDVERAIFLTVLHRLFVSISDRSCDRWHRDYVIDGIDALFLHHLFRAMAFRKELDRRLEKAGHCFEWAEINQDLKALQEITIEDRGKTLTI